MKKIGTYLLVAALLLSLAACAPKRYERMHAPVGSSSVKKSSGEPQEKEKREEKQSDEKDKEAIGLGPCQKRTKRISIRLLKTVRL
ncbi:Uncharacterised protein [Streptococcus parasanguinis]|uniref:Lipoprotein n=1 Tax=Streptococcus parasanguinis TaxID=1318 RepID=A0A6N3C696_STRPA